MKWTEKYRPGNLNEVLGNNKAVSDLRAWARSWEEGQPSWKAVILYGPAGIGKTSAALALAQEFDWDFIEMNASDQRTASKVHGVAGPASRIRTFSGRMRLIILDEADNLHGNYDRGGSAAMLKVVRETSQPIVLIANEYYAIDKTLRDACLGIQFRAIRATTIASRLREICRNEGITCDPEALQMIAEMTSGDLRSGVNDLQAAAQGLTHLSVQDVATGERDVKASIFKVLEAIFKGSSVVEAQRASYSLDESPEDLVHWIDENLPVAYEGADVARGFESLSRADVFLGRVRKRQSYGLWRYAGFLMTGGITASRSKRRGGYVAFKPPSLWRRMGQTRRARGIRDSAASKIAGHCHVGTAYARLELMDFFGNLMKDRGLAPRVAALLNLSPDEIALLMGSQPSTKKVQSVFEESRRLIEEERIEDIDQGLSGGLAKGMAGLTPAPAPAVPVGGAVQPEGRGGPGKAGDSVDPEASGPAGAPASSALPGKAGRGRGEPPGVAEGPTGHGPEEPAKASIAAEAGEGAGEGAGDSDDVADAPSPPARGGRKKGETEKEGPGAKKGSRTGRGAKKQRSLFDFA
ncbi:MAG: replication factor C large subunit [Methanosarcinales archaeon]|nr:replication factor C large subunit [Methanosarcinales archaeon]